jgi:hypothetical protein
MTVKKTSQPFMNRCRIWSFFIIPVQSYYSIICLSIDYLGIDREKLQKIISLEWPDIFPWKPAGNNSVPSHRARIRGVRGLSDRFGQDNAGCIRVAASWYFPTTPNRA